LSSTMLDFSLNSLLQTIRLLLPMTLFYTLPKLLSDDNMLRFDRLLFPIVFIAFISQLSEFFTGYHWVDFFTGSISTSENILLISSESVSRAGSSEVTLLYCFIKGLFYFFNKNQLFPRKYTIAIIFFSSFSIFLSGTRGWIIATAVVLLFTLYQQRASYGLVRSFYLILSGVFFIFIIGLIFPSIDQQISNVIDRLETINKIAEGDLTAGGTLSRITERAPKVMEQVNKSPIFGFGFTSNFIEYADGHVGTQTILLNIGYVGLFIMYFFAIKWLINFYQISKRKEIRFINGDAPLVFTTSLLFLYVVHFTSHLFWGFTMGITGTFTVALFFTSVNNLFSTREKEGSPLYSPSNSTPSMRL
jgi:hypothetical protein